MADVNRRPYHAPVREIAAQRTLSTVLDAARESFLARGYVGTTISQIAAAAGVSRPTVFSVGSKAELFAKVRDVTIAGDDDPRPIVERPSWQRLLAEPDPRATLARYARIAAEINRRYAPLHRVLQRSADVEPDLAELYARSERERRLGAAAAVASVAGKTRLVSSVEIATDTLWILNAPDTYDRLVSDRGWPHGRYVTWFGTTAAAALLG